MKLFNEAGDPVFIYTYSVNGYDGLEYVKYFYSLKELSKEDIQFVKDCYKILEKEYLNQIKIIDDKYEIYSEKVRAMDYKDRYTYQHIIDLWSTEVKGIKVPYYIDVLLENLSIKELKFNGELA